MAKKTILYKKVYWQRSQPEWSINTHLFWVKKTRL